MDERLECLEIVMEEGSLEVMEYFFCLVFLPVNELLVSYIEDVE